MRLCGVFVSSGGEVGSKRGGLARVLDCPFFLVYLMGGVFFSFLGK